MVEQAPRPGSIAEGGGGDKWQRRQFLRLGVAGAALSVMAASACTRAPRSIGKDLSLLIWDGGANVDRTMARIQRRWTTMDGGALKARKVPYTDLDRAVRFTNLGGEQPDIFLVPLPNMISYASLGLIEPVTEMFTEADLADFFPVVRRSATIGGEFYGPSTNENGQALYYDRQLLARYGLAPPETLAGGWTWAEALEVFKHVQAEERRRRGTDQFWALLLQPRTMYFSGVIPRSNGTPGSPAFEMVSRDGATVRGFLDSAEALAGFQFLQDLYHKHAIVPVTKQTDLFLNDQVAFYQGTPYDCGLIRRRRPDIDLASTTIPYLRTPLVHTGAYAWAVNRKAPNMGEAKRLVQFLGSRAGNDIVAREFTSPPIRRSMIADRPELREPPLALFVDTLEHWSVPRPITPGFSEYEAIWNRLTADIVSGGDVQRLVERATVDTDAKLARYF